ncbi:MAG: DUF1538 domain-containing protein [Spirochaetales bacterium]|nr:DUF1538 domain-containing protein [Spirochaetales bacterium]
MDLLGKLKETLLSVLPIMAIVLILNFTITPLGADKLWRFILGGVMLILGLSLFLAGTDIGMVPVGEKLGSVLAHKRNVWFMLTVGFIIGFAVTMAEPDVSVLAGQVHDLNPSIPGNTLILMIALGLGIFVDIGLLRTVLKVKLKWVLFAFYSIVFILVAFIGQSMASISFDASGATTGPLAVPFILALGLGVSASTKDDSDSSFGLTGVASIGPIIAVAFMAMLATKSSGSAAAAAGEPGSISFISVLLETLGETAVGFAPLFAIIMLLQFTLLHFPKIKLKNILLGILYSFIGIVIFLTGVSYGFVEVGMYLGKTISRNFSPVLVVVLALLFGGIVVFAEPAVWVLTRQVETVTAGRIKRSMVMIFICMGVAVAVALAMVRILAGINYLWFVFIGVGLSLLMTLVTPSLFTGIAFDSGGVASGPMSTSFLLSFALGVSGTADMGFGLVGLIAISPLIAIQILGIIFRLKEKKSKKEVRNAAASE